MLATWLHCVLSVMLIFKAVACTSAKEDCLLFKISLSTIRFKLNVKMGYFNRILQTLFIFLVTF